jgi:hypothetical protein
MIRATIAPGGGIRIASDPESALVAAKLPGATRSPKMPIRQWNMPLTIESINILRGVGAGFTPEILAEVKRIVRVHEFIERQKLAKTVEPIAPIPLKPGIRLYQHQVQAVNIALALFGYEVPNG